nr:hypothetical protein [Tanacetum cinerariifolium]
MYIQPHDPDYVPEPRYAEYIPLEDEHVLPAEEKPLPPIDLPTAESSRYVAESDPEEDPEEYEDDETEDGPVDYPMDKRDNGDDDDDDSFRDADVEDEDEDEDEEEDEEEHLDPVDSAIVIPTVELVSPPEGIEPVIPPPSTDTTTTGARITVWLQAAISLSPEAEVERLLAMPTPPPSPLTSLSPPSTRERLARCVAPFSCPSPPPMPSPLLPSSGCPTQIQTLRMASTQAFIDVVTVALPSPPLLPPLYIPPPVDCRDDILEIEMPHRKRLCLSTLGSRYEIEESSTTRPTEDPAETILEIAPMTIGEVNTRVIKLAELHEHDKQDSYAILEDTKDSRTRISQRVTVDSQRVDLLMEDRIAHQETILIMEEETYIAREAWDHSIGLRQAVHYELQTHREHVQIRSLGPDAYSMTWEVLKKKMTDKYCPPELTMICTKFVSNETKKINKYIGVLPDNMYGSVKASKPKTLDETIELANNLMDQKLRTYKERQMNNKRKANDSFRNNHGHQQQPAKRQNVAKIYNIGSGEKKPYEDTCPSAPSAIFITMARVLKNATSATRQGTLPMTAKVLATLMLLMLRGTIRKILRGMVVLNVELQGTSREIA